MAELTYTLLCGGRSTRNYPHVKGLAHKCLLPFGSVRIIDHILGDIFRAGGRDVTLVCQNEQTADAFREALAPMDPDLCAALSKKGLETQRCLTQSIEIPEDATVRYVIQPKPKGTAHALGTAHRATPDNPAVMIFPDDIYLHRDPARPHLLKIVQAFLRDERKILLSGQYMDDVSNVAIIEDGRLIEKPKYPSNNVGIYSPFVFPKALCDHMTAIADKIDAGESVPEMSPSGECIYTDAINSFLGSAAGKAFALHAFDRADDHFYLDCGSLPLYEKALLHSLLTLSAYGAENRAYLKGILDKIQ